MKKFLFYILIITTVLLCFASCDDNASKNKITPIEPIVIPGPNKYITFSSDAPFSITPAYNIIDEDLGYGFGCWGVIDVISGENSLTYGILEYSTDAKSWTAFTTDTVTSATSMQNGDKYYCYIRGKNNTNLTSADEEDSATHHNWIIDATSGVTCSGNIMNLLDYENPNNVTMRSRCFAHMFSDSENLVSAPELPATVLTDNCYSHMFIACTSLTTAPELPATTLASTCYCNMFDGCTSLLKAPELPATILKDNCYNSMFQGCTSLTTAPVLNATTLENHCYNSMFKNCSSLKISATSGTKFFTCPQIVGLYSPVAYMFSGTQAGGYTSDPVVGTTYYYNGN